MPRPESSKKYTYADYLTWSDNERYEIIDGVAYMQSAPTWQHQAISGNIFAQLYAYLKDQPCRVFAAPFDVRFPETDEKDEETTYVVQPDIVVICENEGLKGTGYYGSPTLIIEITSPSTAKMDRLYKFNKYEKARVQEYWIVEPDLKLVSVFVLQDNQRYGRPEVYSEENHVNVSIFPDLTIDLKSVFSNVS